MVKNCFSRSRSTTDAFLILSARSRADAVCHRQLQTRIAGSRQVDHRSRSVASANPTTQIWGCSERLSFPRCFSEIEQLHIFPTSSSKSARNVTVFFTVLKYKSSLATIEVKPRKHRPKKSATPGASSLRAREYVHPWVHNYT